MGIAGCIDKDWKDHVRARARACGPRKGHGLLLWRKFGDEKPRRAIRRLDVEIDLCGVGEICHEKYNCNRKFS